MSFKEDVAQLLTTLTEPLRHKVEARYLARRRPFEKAKSPSIDYSAIDERLMIEFDVQWKDDALRRLLVPGKEVLAALNNYLQGKYGVTISTTLIIDCFKKEDVPAEMKSLIEEIDDFRKETIE